MNTHDVLTISTNDKLAFDKCVEQLTPLGYTCKMYTEIPVPESEEVVYSAVFGKQDIEQQPNCNDCARRDMELSRKTHREF